MFHSVKTYVSNRRRGITKAAAITSGLYMVRGYIRERLEEVKDRLEQERVARENLKRRFNQTQEDASYTVLALIQTLSGQILGDMDVEGLTQELQNRSRARHAARQHSGRRASSIASSIDMVHEHDTRSEAGSAVISVASTSSHVDFHGGASSTSDISTSGLRSWVESSRTPSNTPHENESDSPITTDSITTPDSSHHNAEDVSVAESSPSDSAMSSSMMSDSNSLRTAAELWNEVKILTFTRTLTTLYSTTLLSLLAVLQLTLLARSKYIHSVLQLEREERMRQQFDAQFSLINILLNSGKGLEGLMEMSNQLDEDGVEGVEPISEEVESKFLTMSWWILHVGWKDVGERVRRGVEEAFDGVSLKSKLAAIDLHRLVSDVRRRVEHEITFEGHERRINFLSSLLPPTPETVQHVLSQGGFPSQSNPLHDLLEFDDLSIASSQLSHSHHESIAPTWHPHSHPYTQDPAFSDLLAETRAIITSADFMHVLELCLDHATEVLFTNLEKSVFVASEQPTVPGEPVRIRLAGLLPGLARWSQLAMNALPNELVDNILAVREVACLSAIVFSKFEERFR